MLSSVLRTPGAVAINIEIMRAFVRLREVLAAELPAVGLALAQRAVADRERAPFLDPADFNARVTGATAGAGFGVASSYFVVTTRASYGDSVVQLRTLLYRGSAGKWPDILWQQLL